jgi:hypothetical protein
MGKSLIRGASYAVSFNSSTAGPVTFLDPNGNVYTLAPNERCYLTDVAAVAPTTVLIYQSSTLSTYPVLCFTNNSGHWAAGENDGPGFPLQTAPWVVPSSTGVTYVTGGATIVPATAVSPYPSTTTINSQGKLNG